MKKIHLSKRQWIFTGLVLLLCITGVVNYFFSESLGGQKAIVTQGDQSASANLNFYTTFRAERKQARDQEIAYLDSVINDAKTDSATKKKAQEQKLALASSIEQEITVEGLVKALGFADCVVTIKKGSVNVVVENTAALTSTQAAKIFEIVRKETGESSDNIKIMPKN